MLYYIPLFIMCIAISIVATNPLLSAVAKILEVMPKMP